MTDKWDDEDISDEEVQAMVLEAVSELLNIASIAADLQTTDEAAEEIYATCDLVAEYHGLQRAVIETEENPDGSITSRVRNPHSEVNTTSVPIPGSIRTRDLKYRVVDKNSSPDIGEDWT